MIRNTRQQRRAWVREVLALQGGRCAYCAKRLGREIATADHYVPLAAGGLERIENIVAACYLCNNAKGSDVPQPGGRWWLGPPDPCCTDPTAPTKNWYGKRPPKGEAYMESPPLNDDEIMAAVTDPEIMQAFIDSAFKDGPKKTVAELREMVRASIKTRGGAPRYARGAMAQIASVCNDSIALAAHYHQQAATLGYQPSIKEIQELNALVARFKIAERFMLSFISEEEGQ